MLQNIGQVFSKDAGDLIDQASATSGVSHPGDGAVPPRSHAKTDQAVASVLPTSMTALRLVISSTEASGRTVVSREHQNGLPYLWEKDLPITPEPSWIRLLAFGVKRSMDVVLALGLIFLFAPVLITTALAIKLTSEGPILFRQQRVGFMNKNFSVYKFRTMYVGRQDTTGVQQTTEDDARITRVGKVLRKTSIDELPQIINILKGEMSFVGPRPHVAGMLAGGLRYEELVPYYDLRHVMKPGLTGWAQANGFRGPTIDPVRARQRVDHDIAYIQNFSLWLDVLILMRTAWREFVTGTGV